MFPTYVMLNLNYYIERDHIMFKNIFVLTIIESHIILFKITGQIRKLLAAFRSFENCMGVTILKYDFACWVNFHSFVVVC